VSLASTPGQFLGSSLGLTGRTVLVTGGGGGLGSVMARGIAEAGAAVAVTDLDADRAREVARAVEAAGGRAVGERLDVTDREDVERVVERVAAALGPIDGLVNAAGITRRGSAADFPRADWDRVLDVNLTGTFACCQAVGRRMLTRGRGAIVNVASIAGHIGLPGTIAYIAAKGGVVMLTRGLAVEWAPRGVRVNALAPSWFATDMGNLIDREPEYRERVLRRVPLGRLGRPEELVGATVFLLSDAASMVTGHVLAVDGGVLAV
jgi:NAD(P)-dependent dehydrogenase (short-subunit alcohol dehydrogenase family)